MKFTIWMLSFAWVLGSSSGSEGGGSNWRGESVTRVSLEALDRLRGNLETRADEIEKVLGQRPPLDFRYFHGDLTEEQKSIDKRFRERRLTKRSAEDHVEGYLKDFERVRASLVPLENKAARKWKVARAEEEKKQGKIFDIKVSAARLGVILDNSPSMDPFLDQVREEISRDFPMSYTVEVNGSFMLKRFLYQPAVWFYAERSEGVNPFGEGFLWQGFEDHVELHNEHQNWTMDNVAAITAMAKWMDKDAIYWFCDFDDKVEDEAVEQLATVVRDTGVTLYVHTLKNRPPRILADLIKESGGKLVRKRLKD